MSIGDPALGRASKRARARAGAGGAGAAVPSAEPGAEVEVEVEAGTSGGGGETGTSGVGGEATTSGVGGEATTSGAGGEAPADEPDRADKAPRPTPPRHRVVRRRKPGRPALSQPTGPHVRLGILWAAVTLAALLEGPVWLTLWLAPVAALAAGSAARTWGTAAVADRSAHNRRVRVQPPAAVAAAFSALITVAALAGGLVVAVVVALVAVVLVAAATFGPLGQPGVVRRLVIVLGPGVAASSLVLARVQGLATGLVLAGMVTVFDSSNYLIGTGAPNRWEGSVAGVASLAALTLVVAAVLAPPFTGASPWLLGGAVAVLAPIGPVLGRWVTGDEKAPVPALRRLDSLFLAGPAWAAGVAMVLHR